MKSSFVAYSDEQRQEPVAAMCFDVEALRVRDITCKMYCWALFRLLTVRISVHAKVLLNHVSK